MEGDKGRKKRGDFDEELGDGEIERREIVDIKDVEIKRYGGR